MPKQPKPPKATVTPVPSKDQPAGPTADLPNIDGVVGANLRALRDAAGLTRSELEQKLGFGRGALSRIETGKSTLPAGDLWAASRLFKVTPMHFYAGLSPQPARPASDLPDVNHVEQLARNFVAIGDDQIRRSILALVRATSRQR